MDDLRQKYFDLEPSWEKELSEELKKPYIPFLASFVETERRGQFPIYPSKELVFNALWKTPFDKVRVVIVGQDPYHGPGQAHGLSFSVPIGVPPPPSLVNIFKEISADLKTPPPAHGCLLKWAEQGVLLLNASLTVRQGTPMSHSGKGWEQFTDAVIMRLSLKKEPLAFVLWGKSAQEKCRHLRQPQFSHHLLLTAPHPSPLSAHQGFFGCGHFSKINNWLIQKGMPIIEWNI